MTMPLGRRSSLLERAWESFFGFSDKAVEEHFLTHQIQLRKILLCGFSIINIAGAIPEILCRSASGTLTATFIFLQPCAPVTCLLSVIAFALERWRWVEPMANATYAVRLIGEVMWLSPACSSAEFNFWNSIFSSRSTCNLWLLLCIGANFATHVRFKVAFWVLMIHIAFAPFIVAQSTAELSTLWMLLAHFCAIAMRLWDDMRSRAAFLKLPPAPAKASDDCGAYGDMTDEEFMELCRLATSSTYELSVVTREHKVFLRIPDADPSDMCPDAEAKLKSGFEAQFPGYTVTEITFQRGSLLVGIRVSSPGEAEPRSSADSSPQMLEGVSNSTWLSWLGLPTDMEMSGKVDVPTDRRVNWLDGFPLAATVLKSEQGFTTVSFPLLCTASPQDVAFKASLGARVLECHVLVCPSDEGDPNIGPGAKQSCVTLQVDLRTDALGSSPCCLLTVNVQSLTDHVIIGDRTVVLLLNDLTDMESDLCSLRLLSHSDEAHGLAFDLQKQLYGAHIAYAVGWWLQTMNIKRQRGGGRKEGGTVDSEQPNRMWRAGNSLLLHLVGNGCTAAAKHVVHVLLNSPALHPFIHQRMHRVGSDSTGRFYDYYGGEIHPRGSSMLHLAIKSGCCAMVDEVLRWTQAYQLPSLWVVQDRFGMTPLHIAVLINEGGMATFLLQKRCPVLMRAWHYNGGRAGSPEHFSKRKARIPVAAGGMVDHQGLCRTGLNTRAQERVIPPSESVPAVSTNRLGLAVPPPWYLPMKQLWSSLAVPPPWYRLMKQLWSSLAVPPPWYLPMKQLWSSLDVWPNAEQQKKIIMYKMEKTSMAMKIVCLLQALGQMGIALRGGFCLLSLHAILVACLFSMPTVRALYKGDYLSVERNLFAWSFVRRAFFHHIFCTIRPVSIMMFIFFNRLVRPAVEPIRFHWALAENLGMLVLNCILPNGISLHWVVLFHVLGLLITVGEEIRYQKQYRALVKSQ